VVKEEARKGETRKEEVRKANGAAAGGRVATSPAIRRMAHEAGVDLTKVPGSGPNGRIVREDFESFVAKGKPAPAAQGRQGAGAGLSARGGGSGGVGPRAGTGAGAAATEEIKVIGVRRLIAQKMSDAKRNIPHFAYVE